MKCNGLTINREPCCLDHGHKGNCEASEPVVYKDEAKFNPFAKLKTMKKIEGGHDNQSKA